MLYGVQVWVKEIEPNWDKTKPGDWGKIKMRERMEINPTTGEKYPVRYFCPTKAQEKAAHDLKQGAQIVRRLHHLPPLGWPESEEDAARIKTEAMKILKSKAGKELLVERLKKEKSYVRQNKTKPPTLRGPVMRGVRNFFDSFIFPSSGKSTG